MRHRERATTQPAPPPPPPLPHGATHTTGRVSKLAEMRAWLEDIGMGAYVGALREFGCECVDDLEEVLPSDLRALGVRVLHVRRFTRKLQARATASEAGTSHGGAVAQRTPPSAPSFVDHHARGREGVETGPGAAYTSFSDIPASASPFNRISRDELHIQRLVGRGSYGVVHQATWRGSSVAVKSLANTGDSTGGGHHARRGELQKELGVMVRCQLCLGRVHALGLRAAGVRVAFLTGALLFADACGIPPPRRTLDWGVPGQRRRAPRHGIRAWWVVAGAVAAPHCQEAATGPYCRRPCSSGCRRSGPPPCLGCPAPRSRMPQHPGTKRLLRVGVPHGMPPAHACCGIRWTTQTAGSASPISGLPVCCEMARQITSRTATWDLSSGGHQKPSLRGHTRKHPTCACATM